MAAELITGDDIAIPVTLKINGQTFTIPPTATVEAQLVLPDHTGTWPGALKAVQSESAPGADWANSLVMVEFAGADTVAIADQGKALIEIQVDDNGKRTWFVTVKVVLGQIA